MPSQWGGFRTVIPDNDVTEIIDAAYSQYARFDEAWRALEWLLSRAGERVGRPAKGDETLRLYVQSDDEVAGVPAIWVVYRVTPDEIEIQAIRLIDPQPEQE